MLTSRNLDKIIYLDVESTSQYPTFNSMPELLQAIFKKRFKSDLKEFDDNWTIEKKDKFLEDLYSAKSPLYAEYAKIICITVGWFQEKDITDTYQGDLTLKTKSFFGEDEVKLLTDFHKALGSVLDKSFNHSHHLAAYGGLFFDFPMIAKRFILNRLPLPAALDYMHLKPWEVGFLICPSTVFKYGQFDGGCSLDMLAYSFGIESSKGAIDGSKVKYEYWVNKNLAGIERYCCEDVRVLAEVYLRLKNMSNKVIIV